MTQKFLKTALFASAATLLIAAGPKADLNQDGQVTKAEFMESAETHFTSVDADANGLLSKEERKSFRAAKVDEMKNKVFDKLDADGDGAVSRDEMNAAGEKMKSRMNARKEKFMERYDTNLDGELSDAERTVMKAERETKRGDRATSGKRAERRNAEGGKKGWRSRRGQRPNADANDDGFVSLDEHLAVSEKLFARLDANDDGVLTEGEGKRRRGKRGGRRGG